MSISETGWACVGPDWTGNWLNNNSVRCLRKESQGYIGEVWVRQDETIMQGWKRAYRRGWRCVRVTIEVIKPYEKDLPS